MKATYPRTRGTMVSANGRIWRAGWKGVLLAAAVAFTTGTLQAKEPSAYATAVSVTELLKTQTDGAGQKITYPQGGSAEITAVLVEIPPGAQTNWHHHPLPCLAYLLEGELEIETQGKPVRTLRAGEAFAEVVDLLHNGSNRSSKPARLVMFVLGVEGKPYVVRAAVTAPGRGAAK